MSKKETKQEVKEENVQILSLNILEVVHQTQQQNGLKTGNHLRYHKYCSQRLRRIRKSLGITHGKNKFTKREEIISEMKDLRYLFLALIKAERAWSYAAQLKSEKPSNSKEKKHIIRRLKKASKWSSYLLSICQQTSDSRTVLEAEAYNAWMEAQYLVETEKWKESLQKFITARTIFSKLSEVVKIQFKDIYTRRILLDIDPLIKFCDYKLNKTNQSDSTDVNDILTMMDKVEDGTMDLLKSKLEGVLEETRKKQSENLDDIYFLGKTVPITNEKIRRNILNSMNISNEIKKLNDNEEKLKLYDKLLIQLTDSLSIIKDEIKQKTIEKTSTEQFMSSMRILNSYINYLSLSFVIDRNLIMVQQLLDDKKNPPKAASLTRLYEIILQNLVEIQSLPGISDYKILSNEIEAKLIYYRSLKCFYLAKSFSEIEKWKESISLLKRSEELAGISKSSFEKSNIKVDYDIKSFLSIVRKEICISKAKYVLGESKVTFEDKKVTVKDPILSNLNSYQIDKFGKPTLIQFPPDYEVIQTKPLYFDMALKSIEYPSLQDKMEKKKWFGIW